MANEIEFKFKLKNNDWQQKITNQYKIVQGYLSLEKEVIIKIVHQQYKPLLEITRGSTQVLCPINNVDASLLLELSNNDPVLSNTAILVIRARTRENIDTNKKEGFITIKGPAIATANGASSNPEFEYNLPFGVATTLLDMTDFIVYKNRYEVIVDNYKWEIDIFKEELSGMELAELEVANGTSKPETWPDWLAEDVSNDHAYKNVNLAKQAANIRKADSYNM